MARVLRMAFNVMSRPTHGAPSPVGVSILRRNALTRGARPEYWVNRLVRAGLMDRGQRGPERDSHKDATESLKAGGMAWFRVRGRFSLC